MKKIDVEKLYQIAGKDAVRLEEELFHLLKEVGSDFRLKSILDDLGISPADKKKLLEDVFAKSSPVFCDLMRLLIDEELCSGLNRLAREYSDVVSKKTGTVLVGVASAFPLSDNEKKRIKDRMADRTRVLFTVDPKLIGGARLNWQDGRFMDASLLGSMEKLKEEILA